MRYLSTFIFLFFFLLATGQEQVKVMHYNLLNFGVLNSYCTLENNDPFEKMDGAKTIVDYYLPDVLVVNEMSPSNYYQGLFLDEVMNASGRENYARAVGTNQAGSNIANMLYYNEDVLGVAAQDVIEFWLRDINVYKMYFETDGLSQTNDTIFLYIISAHFKAGTSGSDKTTRSQMATAIVNYLQNKQIAEPCLLCGDLNLQNNLEPAWSDLTVATGEYQFVDPTGLEGIWHNNGDYAPVHTQSTQTEYDGCKASGGMDDRFDFILANSTLMDPESNVRFVDDSYEVPGQDGLRLNGSLIDPPNNSAPAEIIEAMFNLSDHLPVVIELEFEQVNPLPESWNFTVTDVSHALYLPFEIQPTVNSEPITEGSYIGMFYTEGGTAFCAGYNQWSGGTDIELKCYGDDMEGRNKNGFYENEPIIFKIYEVQQHAEFYCDVDLNPTFPDHDGRFHSNGVSVLNGLYGAYLQYHTIEINEGWNSLSSFLVPRLQTIESVFGANLSKVIYMQDGNFEWYPGGGVSDLSYWIENSTFILKAAESFTIDVDGLLVEETGLILHSGWNMIAVPVPCYVNPEDLETDPPGAIIAIQAISAAPVFWPEKEIFTLDILVPGNAYLIYITDDCSLIFEPCK